ncbi:hypothetical protein SAMN04488130_101328 [Flavobacterium urumqiense]|uniref:Uncharacterized protein n=1 Tax=Flavobacterium urumqiense TaxID=935224 RepID=A0A1H5SK80_9FLAO|nr:hypothetical protein SAMN04488130_101328 [Flavobacterium urumqiense]
MVFQIGKIVWKLKGNVFWKSVVFKILNKIKKLHFWISANKNKKKIVKQFVLVK